jgi:hypothetical protein
MAKEQKVPFSGRCALKAPIKMKHFLSKQIEP